MVFTKQYFDEFSVNVSETYGLNFPGSTQGFINGGESLGQIHFRVLPNPKHLKNTGRDLNESKPRVLVYPGGNSQLAARQTHISASVAVFAEAKLTQALHSRGTKARMSGTK